MLRILKTVLNATIVFLFISFSSEGYTKPVSSYINELTYNNFKCINGLDINKNKLLVFLDNHVTNYKVMPDGSIDIGFDEVYTTAKGRRIRLEDKESVVVFKPDVPETENKTLFVLTKLGGRLKFEVIDPLKLLNNEKSCITSTFSLQPKNQLDILKLIGNEEKSGSDEDNYKAYVKRQINHNKMLLNRIFNRHSRKTGQKKAYIKLNIIVRPNAGIDKVSVIETDISVERTVNIIIARLKFFKLHKKFSSTVNVEYQIDFESS